METVLLALIPAGTILITGIVLKRHLTGIDTRFDKIDTNLDHHERSNGKSFERVHERIDDVAKEQSKMHGYLEGLKNGRIQ